MIINLQLKTIQTTTGSTHSFPELQFDDASNWEFTFIKFCGILKRKVETRGVYRLSTNLIDRDVSNPDQAISYIGLGRNTTYVELEPTNLLKYKLRFRDFSDVQFNFQEISSEKILEFQSAVIQLEINETYGRF